MNTEIEQNPETIIEIEQNPETIIEIQANDFRTLMKLAHVSEVQFCKLFGIETITQLRKNQVDLAMCMLFEQGLNNHRLQVDNHG